MKSRFSSLIKLKKSTMQKSEQLLQKASANLNSAAAALSMSYSSLETLEPPKSGKVSEMLASRTLLASQRELINHNKEWFAYAQNQLDGAKERLKKDMLEFEKFQYLEVQELKKELKKRELKEKKELDEIALMTYNGSKK